jgi:digeranylgeranylglycerophospholipid reductase
MDRYDVAVIGGSVAGLTFGAEAAKRGISVCILEEHQEIGEPEKCDGLVSLNMLRMFGYQPSISTIQEYIRKGVLHSPLGRSLEFDTGRMELAVLDRSLYDKQLSKTAEYRGAEINTGIRVKKIKKTENSVIVEAEGKEIEARFVIDASGPSSSPRKGLIPAAKYEIEADWVESSSFHVYFNQEIFPGFFGWVISSGKKRAKVGVAGRYINPYVSLENFLAGSDFTLIRRIGSPIYIGGPSYPFVNGRVVKVGESAGQVKPTTAGGISLAVASAVLAARWVCEAVEYSSVKILKNYERDWRKRFGREMRLMLSMRMFFESLTNTQIERLFSLALEHKLQEIIIGADFDFHASSILRNMGMKKALRIFLPSFPSLIRAMFARH